RPPRRSVSTPSSRPWKLFSQVASILLVGVKAERATHFLAPEKRRWPRFPQANDILPEFSSRDREETHRYFKPPTFPKRECLAANVWQTSVPGRKRAANVSAWPKRDSRLRPGPFRLRAAGQ